MNNPSGRFSPRLLLLLIGGLLLLALGFWLSQHITWKEEEIDAGLSEAARKDPFYAANLFLQRQGVATQTLRSFSLLDNLSWQGQALHKNDTLVLLNAHKLLKGRRLDNLLAWVERGGVVIASTNNPFIGNSTDTRDLLLDQFDISVQRSAYNALFDTEDYSDDDYLDEYLYEDSGDEVEANTSGTEENTPDENDSSEAPVSDTEDPKSATSKARLRCNLFINPAEVRLNHEPESLLVDYSRGQAFDYYGLQPTELSRSNTGLQLAYFNQGSGRVVINSDNHIWENLRIDCHDHAYLLWKLINPGGKVWFVINQEAPSLWTIIWRSAPYGALAALLALALWLWAKAVRFGPILTRVSSGRRSLAEHIHASAMLLWRRQQHRYLITQLRNDLRQQLLKHYPLFNDWARAEQIAQLQTLTTLSSNELEKALFSDQLLSPQDFTAAVACLQTIRKSL